MSTSVSGVRDVLFERALGGLPVPLLTALRGSGLDDAATLLHYLVDWEDEGERGVPSGATSTGHSSIPTMCLMQVSHSTHARHAHARVKRESHHTRCTQASFLKSTTSPTVLPGAPLRRIVWRRQSFRVDPPQRPSHVVRCTTSHLFSSAGPPTFALPRPLCCVVGSFVFVTMPLYAQSSSSSVARDVLWVRALGTLSDELRSALCAAGLDDPWVLCEYPTESRQNKEVFLGGSLEKGGALSGAASTSHLSFSSLTTTLVSTGPSSSGTGSAGRVGVSGTGRVPEVLVEEKGGDPRTDHASFVGEALVEQKGGDPKTDHASFGVVAQSGDGRYLSSLSAGVSGIHNCQFRPSLH